MKRQLVRAELPVGARGRQSTARIAGEGGERSPGHVQSLIGQEMSKPGVRAFFLRYDQKPCTALVQHEPLR